MWPLSLAVRLLTLSFDAEGDDAETEARAVLATLRESSGGSGLMHESFWFDDPSRFTRPWFAMANSAFAEALLRLAEVRPHLLFSDAAVEARA